MTVDRELSVLESSGLIELASMQPELEYLFRHVLVQDAAYASLLKQERRALHLRVADALEALYPERRAQAAGVLALHLEQAGETARAAPYLVEAGEHALRRFANREARAFFDRAAAYLPKDDPRPETLRLRVRATVGARKAGWTFSPADGEVAAIAEVLPLAETLGDLRLLSEVHFWHAFVRRARGETPETSPDLARSLERLSKIGAELGDPVAQAVPQALIGLGLVFTGHLREGAAMLEGALPTLEASGDALAAALMFDGLVLAYARLGDFAAAERAAEGARRLAERGDPIARLDYRIALSAIAAERGDVGEAVAIAGQCSLEADELGATSCGILSNLILGDGRIRLGEAALAKPALERSSQLAAALNVAVLRNHSVAWLSFASARLGDLAAALGGWGETLRVARGMGDRFGEASVLRQRAVSGAGGPSPDWGAVFADFADAIRLFEELAARPALARTLREHARALSSAGRADEAAAAAKRADALFAALRISEPEPAAA